MARLSEATALIDHRRIVMCGARRRCFDLGAELLRAVLRDPAEKGGVVVVPPLLAVGGGAINDDVARARGFGDAFDEAYEIRPAQPGCQHPPVLRLGKAGADADADALDAELFIIVAGQRFAETFRDTIKTVR